MKATHSWLLVIGLAFGLCQSSSPGCPDESEHAKLLLGQWILAKPYNNLAVEWFEFDKNGKARIRMTVDGNLKTIDMLYKLEGEEILLGFKSELAYTLAIRTITKSQLILGIEDGMEIELKRSEKGKADCPVDKKR